MRAVLKSLAIALVALPAYAQPSLDGGIEDPNGPPKEHVGAARAMQSRGSEARYKSALDRIPDQKYDPWGNIRDATPPVTAAKKSNKGSVAKP
jgi:hypothetical protein